MYRAILSEETTLQEFEFECGSCGRISYRQLKCSVSGKLVGQGFEYVCTKCRGTLKRKTLNDDEKNLLFNICSDPNCEDCKVAIKLNDAMGRKLVYE